MADIDNPSAVTNGTPEPQPVVAPQAMAAHFVVLGIAPGPEAEEKVRAFIGRYGRYVLLQVTDYDQALKFFQKHDVKVVFWGRFVPGIRSLISLPAGVARMPFGPFALYTLLGTVLWSGALLLAGYLLGARWELVLDVVDRFELVLWAIVFALLAAWVVWRLRARARHRVS